MQIDSKRELFINGIRSAVRLCKSTDLQGFQISFGQRRKGRSTRHHSEILPAEWHVVLIGHLVIEDDGIDAFVTTHRQLLADQSVLNHGLQSHIRFLHRCGYGGKTA